ncbi:MAG: hypothetical protein ABSE73_16510 [Planctomycetota bacterium]
MPDNPPPPPAPIPAPTPSCPVAPAPGAPPQAAPLPVAALADVLSFSDFQKVKLLTAEIVSAVAHPKADKLVIMQIKVGERTKQIVAGIREFYAPEQLAGKTIIIVDNLQPRKLRGEESCGMLLAVSLPGGGLRLLTTDAPAPSGLPVS